jgi:hypothetical protein
MHEERSDANLRNRKESDHIVTMARLENALCRIARIVAEGRTQFLPIFLRLEKEVATCNENENALRRAERISREKNE